MLHILYQSIDTFSDKVQGYVLLNSPFFRHMVAVFFVCCRKLYENKLILSVDIIFNLSYKSFPNAGVAQLVERDLAKVEVAGSNPVTRLFGDVAEGLGSGLQSRVPRFKSGRRLLCFYTPR